MRSSPARPFFYSWSAPICHGLLLLLPANTAPAQQTSQWQGEWGAFTGAHADLGRRLSIHDCDEHTCKFSIEARSAAGHSETSSNAILTLQSSTTAVTNLPGETTEQTCTLRFELEAGVKPAIRVEATGAACTSYYSTSPAVSMGGIYPLRATRSYSGMHAEECFLDTSPALMTTCTHSELAALEQKWEFLADEYPLHPPTKALGGGSQERQLDAALLRSCDASPDPAQCLSKRYTGEITAMQAKKDAYLASTEQRGDPALGGQLAAKIAGQYRHSSPNGDVQGDHYITTDTLSIHPVGPASIHFDARLNFFNGHICSLSGGALFRKNGSFVFDDKSENAALSDTPACRLAIIPTDTGVQFKDITGGCKNYCGERGSWNGGGFTFAQRVGKPDTAATK